MSLNKIEIYLKVGLGLLIAFVCLSNLQDIHKITLDKPYFTGEWDEPFAVIGGINALKKGDPRFYWYGGPCVYPFTVSFEINKIKTGEVPYYKLLDEKLDQAGFVYTHKIFPVKPIYQVKIFATVIYVIGAFILTFLFSLLLFPFPWLFLSSIQYSQILAVYESQMLAEVLLVYASGLTTLLFTLAIFEKDPRRYKKLTLGCAVLVSSAIAVKVNAVYLALLPISLCIQTVREANSFKAGIKEIRSLVLALVLPFCILDPAIFINGRNYLNYFRYISKMAVYIPHNWGTRTHEIFDFSQNIYLLNAWPNSVLISLFLLTCILLIKRNALAFFGFCFFYFFSAQVVLNMKLPMYPRHLDLLTFPFIFFILYPFFEFYKFASKKLKVFTLTVGLVFSLFSFPLNASLMNWHDLFHGSYAGWAPESRDQLREFVLKSGAVIYFYDVHEFSLPNDIDSSLKPFTELGEIPATLKNNEYVGFIQYKNFDPEKSKKIVDVLKKKYRVIRVFGDERQLPDFSITGPKSNPLILILK